MGDRCYMKLECRRQDAPRFEALGFYIEEDESKADVATMVDEGANYAHSGDMPEDIPYYGWHDTGGGYEACVFACDGKKLAEATCLRDWLPVVSVKEDGSLIQEMLEQAREYLACLARAMPAIKKE